MSENIYAFIDSQNLNLGVLDQGWKLDFQKFRYYLKQKYHVNKAFLFIGEVNRNRKLYKKLFDFGYDLILKPTLKIKCNANTKIKGNVDAELVLHSMIQLPNYDRAIIITGDGDFYCLIEYLQTIEKFGALIVPNPNKYSTLLKQFRNHIYFIEENQRGKLELKKRE